MIHRNIKGAFLLLCFIFVLGSYAFFSNSKADETVFITFRGTQEVKMEETSMNVDATDSSYTATCTDLSDGNSLAIIISEYPSYIEYVSNVGEIIAETLEGDSDPENVFISGDKVVVLQAGAFLLSFPEQGNQYIQVIVDGEGTPEYTRIETEKKVRPRELAYRILVFSQPTYDKIIPSSWKSDNESVVQMGGNEGLFVARQNGTAIVTCETFLHRKLSCSITVDDSLCAHAHTESKYQRFPPLLTSHHEYVATCKDCNTVIMRSLSLHDYTTIDPTTKKVITKYTFDADSHTKTCGLCGYQNTSKHIWRYTSVANIGQIKTCAICQMVVSNVDTRTVAPPPIQTQEPEPSQTALPEPDPTKFVLTPEQVIMLNAANESSIKIENPNEFDMNDITWTVSSVTNDPLGILNIKKDINGKKLIINAKAIVQNTLFQYNLIVKYKGINVGTVLVRVGNRNTVPRPNYVFVPNKVDVDLTGRNTAEVRLRITEEGKLTFVPPNLFSLNTSSPFISSRIEGNAFVLTISDGVLNSRHVNEIKEGITATLKTASGGRRATCELNIFRLVETEPEPTEEVTPVISTRPRTGFYFDVSGIAGKQVISGSGTNNCEINVCQGKGQLVIPIHAPSQELLNETKCYSGGDLLNIGHVETVAVYLESPVKEYVYSCVYNDENKDATPLCYIKVNIVDHNYSNGTCTRCGAQDPASVTPVPTHVHSWGSWVVFSENEHRRYCTLNFSHVETLPHTFGNWENGETDDSRQRVCPTCGYKQVEKIQSENPTPEPTPSSTPYVFCWIYGHSWGEWHWVQNSGKNRIESRQCARCQASETRAVSPAPTSQNDVPVPIQTEEITPVPTEEPTPVTTQVPTPTPTRVPTPTSTRVPTPTPTRVPTPTPTRVPTPTPTRVPTPTPTVTPVNTAAIYCKIYGHLWGEWVANGGNSRVEERQCGRCGISETRAVVTTPNNLPVVSTKTPTPSPTKTPTPSPTKTPTPSPTKTPTPSPTKTPTPSPTKTPTPSPSKTPTPSPTKTPTPSPSKTPTPSPTKTPTPSPTKTPTPSPTKTPTQSPTTKPTNKPNPNNNDVPTQIPVTPVYVTASPTLIPTTAVPTATPIPVTTPMPNIYPLKNLGISVIGLENEVLHVSLGKNTLPNVVVTLDGIQIYDGNVTYFIENNEIANISANEINGIKQGETKAFISANGYLGRNMTVIATELKQNGFLSMQTMNNIIETARQKGVYLGSINQYDIVETIRSNIQIPAQGYGLMNGSEIVAIKSHIDSTFESEEEKILNINKIITTAVLRANSLGNISMSNMLGEAVLNRITRYENGSPYYLLDYIGHSTLVDIKNIVKSSELGDSLYKNVDDLIVKIVSTAPYITMKNLAERISAIKEFTIMVKDSVVTTPIPTLTVGPNPTSKPHDDNPDDESFIIDENNNKLGRIIIDKDMYTTIVVDARKGNNPTFTYKVQDSNIVSVDDIGNVKGRNPGRTTLIVTITYDNLKTEQLKYTVVCKEPTNSIVIEPTNVNISKDQYMMIRVNTTPLGANKLYISTNPRVAICAGDGTILATGTGECYIYATSGNVVSNRVHVISQ